MTLSVRESDIEFLHRFTASIDPMFCDSFILNFRTIFRVYRVCHAQNSRTQIK